MKTFCCALALMVLVPTAGFPAGVDGEIGTKSEPMIIAKITTFDKWCEYRQLTQKEFTDIENQLKIEEKFMAKAISAAQKEWNAAEDTKNTRFPVSTVVTRRISAVGRFTDQGKARDKLSALLSKQKEDQQAEAQNDSAKQKDMSVGQKAKAIRREGDYQSALKLIQTKLEEIMAKKDEKAGGDNNAGEQGADGKERLKLL